MLGTRPAISLSKWLTGPPLLSLGAARFIVDTVMARTDAGPTAPARAPKRVWAGPQSGYLVVIGCTFHIPDQGVGVISWMTRP